jgi:spermidine synthase
MSLGSEKALGGKLGEGFGTQFLVPSFAGTMLISAGLLFLIQPIFARMALPLLGGSPSVWAIAMCFFQAVLLAGYAYAHAISKYLSLKQGVILHIALLLLAYVTLPISSPVVTEMQTGAGAGLWLSWIFLKSVGFPFFVLSATAPLLQNWFSRTSHPSADNPYFLYGASNLGSIGSLIVYPLIIEHTFGLSAQSTVWTLGFVALACAMMFCGLLVVSQKGASQAIATTQEIAAPITGWDRLEWIILSFVPSALLVAWTNHLTMDITSAPFLWLPPLVLFLLTFVVIFRDRPMISPKLLGILQIVALPLALFFPKAASLGYTSASFAFGAISFFATACLCHHRLYLRRPAASKLTEFYMIMSVGGVLGGLFVSLIAPVVFTRLVEYPMLLVLGLFLRNDLLQNQKLEHFVPSKVFVPVATVLATLMFMARDMMNDVSVWYYVQGIGCVAACVGFAMMKRTSWIAYPIVLSIISTITAPTDVLHASRSYFGVMKVQYSKEKDYKILSHGTTQHGSQAIAPQDELKPLSYYSPEGGMGRTVKAVQAQLTQQGRQGTYSVVGLGAGSLACYAQSGEQWTFHEIDPSVINIARDPQYFTFLSKCGPDMRMVEGDARLMLTHEPAKSVDLLIIDAFSSDSVPVHLLTEEALKLYTNVLSDTGTIVFHVSNRFMDLEPVVTATMKRVKPAVEPIAIVHRFKEPSDVLYGSDVIVFSANADVNKELLAREDAKVLTINDQVDAWTDDYSNIPGAIWRKVSR